MQRFVDEITVITGGGSGIGAATTRRLVAEGGRAVILGRTVEKLAEVQRHAPDRIEWVEVDLTDPDAVERVITGLGERFGRIDHLVNNAASNVLGGINEVDVAALRAGVDSMVTAVYATTRAALPHLRRSPVASVVNVGSISGLRGDRSHIAYNAGKAAVARMTDSLALDIGAQVRVNAVHPGFIAGTGMTAGAEQVPAVVDPYLQYTPRGRLGAPDDVAAAVAFLLSSDADFINGAHLTVDGGMTASIGQPVIVM